MKPEYNNITMCSKFKIISIHLYLYVMYKQYNKCSENAELAIQVSTLCAHSIAGDAT